MDESKCYCFNHDWVAEKTEWSQGVQYRVSYCKKCGIRQTQSLPPPHSIQEEKR